MPRRSGRAFAKRHLNRKNGFVPRRPADPQGISQRFPYVIAFEKHEQHVLILVGKPFFTITASLRCGPSRSPRRQRGTFQTARICDRNGVVAAT
jgi:hypothetical protein